MNKKNFIISICSLILIILFVIAFNYYSRPRLYELDVNQVKEKIDNKESFILCISATYCSHCKEYKPKLEDISKEYRMDIYYIDFDKYSDKEQELFRNYVSFDGGTPVTLFIKNGEEKTTATRIIGDVSSEKIIDKLKKNDFIK